PPSSWAVPTSRLPRSPGPAGRCALVRVPPHVGNPAKWLLELAAQSALPVSPTPGTSSSKVSHPSVAAGHAATETCRADVLPATDLSSRPPELVPNLAGPHARHLAPTPPSTLRPDNSAPTSVHRAGRSSPARLI